MQGRKARALVLVVLMTNQPTRFVPREASIVVDRVRCLRVNEYNVQHRRPVSVPYVTRSCCPIYFQTNSYCPRLVDVLTPH
jgi:hypothetical protein